MFVNKSGIEIKNEIKIGKPIALIITTTKHCQLELIFVVPLNRYKYQLY